MLWWRRNEGFEWKEYVRTTVLVRRRQRRERVDAAAHAAADALKDAGRLGVAAGAAGANAAGRGAAKLAKSVAEQSAAGAQRTTSVLAQAAMALRRGIATLSAPANRHLSKPNVARGLAVVAILAGIATTIRVSKFGFDPDALLLAVTAGGAALLWIWPVVFPHDQLYEHQDADAPAEPSELKASLGPALQIGGLAAFAGLFLWINGPAVHAWFTAVAPAPAAPSSPALSPDHDHKLTGTARVMGPALLNIAGKEIRLSDITMLETGQTCRRTDGSSWTCGQAAKAALEKLVRGRRDVVCTPTNSDKVLTVATCLTGGRDLAAELVRAGHAFADGTFWATYGSQEAEARTAATGLWAGDGERPEAWRARMWEEARAKAPGGCPVKGRFQFRRKIYVIPGDPGYAALKMRDNRRNRWFCSTQEAEAAGYRPR